MAVSTTAGYRAIGSTRLNRYCYSILQGLYTEDKAASPTWRLYAVKSRPTRRERDVLVPPLDLLFCTRAEYRSGGCGRRLGGQPDVEVARHQCPGQPVPCPPC